MKYFAGLADSFTESAIARARGLDRSFMTAQEAARIAATALFEGDSLLPGTGGQAWKELFRAAKKFSESDAYREQPFPVVSEGARCVLCQQTLGEGGPRLSRFSSFIQQETEKSARETQEKVDQVQKQIAAIRFDGAYSDEALLTEIQDLQESLPQSIRDFVAGLAQRKTHLLVAMEFHRWTAAPILPSNPMPDLVAISQRLTTEAGELERAAVDKDRKKIESEYRELTARKKFSSRKTAVLAAIAKSQMYVTLQACIRATDTTAISKKSTELQQERITADLTTALNVEFAALGAKSLRVILTPRTERGKPLQKLKLDLPSPASGAEEISQLLSEGEQRILAIASFWPRRRLSITDRAWFLMIPFLLSTIFIAISSRSILPRKRPIDRLSSSRTTSSSWSACGRHVRNKLSLSSRKTLYLKRENSVMYAPISHSKRGALQAELSICEAFIKMRTSYSERGK